MIDPRVVVNRKWRIQGGEGRTDKAIEQAAQGHGLAVSRSGETLHMRGGSQVKMRLLGGWFVRPTVLPKEGTVTREAAEGSAATVALQLRDTLGIGIMDRKLRKKYQRALDAIAADIGSALTDAADTCREQPPG